MLQASLLKRVELLRGSDKQMYTIPHAVPGRGWLEMRTRLTPLEEQHPSRDRLAAADVALLEQLTVQLRHVDAPRIHSSLQVG